MPYFFRFEAFEMVAEAVPETLTHLRLETTI